MATQNRRRYNFFDLPDDEQFICPYNSDHHIWGARVPQHLMKCRKAHLAESRRRHSKPKFVVCRYSSVHHFETEELEAHEKRCPDGVMWRLHLALRKRCKGRLPYSIEDDEDEGDEVEEEEDTESTPTTEAANVTKPPLGAEEFEKASSREPVPGTSASCSRSLSGSGCGSSGIGSLKLPAKAAEEEDSDIEDDVEEEMKMME